MAVARLGVALDQLVVVAIEEHQGQPPLGLRDRAGRAPPAPPRRRGRASSTVMPTRERPRRRLRAEQGRQQRQRQFVGGLVAQIFERFERGRAARAGQAGDDDQPRGRLSPSSRRHPISGARQHGERGAQLGRRRGLERRQRDQRKIIAEKPAPGRLGHALDRSRAAPDRPPAAAAPRRDAATSTMPTPRTSILPAMVAGADRRTVPPISRNSVWSSAISTRAAIDQGAAPGPTCRCPTGRAAERRRSPGRLPCRECGSWGAVLRRTQVKVNGAGVRGLGGRQADDEAGALYLAVAADAVFGADGAVMAFDDLLRDRQAEAGMGSEFLAFGP